MSYGLVNLPVESVLDQLKHLEFNEFIMYLYYQNLFTVINCYVNAILNINVFYIFSFLLMITSVILTFSKWIG